MPDTCDVASTDVYNFVRRLYNLCLEREPEWTGCASWAKKLTSGEKNGAMTAYGFFMSAEMTRRGLSNASYVEILYRAMMNRAPDASGKAYWVDLLNNGVSRAGVFRGFAESAEFTRICDRYDIIRGNVDRSKLEPRDVNKGVTMFVARCYTKALNRNYDVTGLNKWCDKINSATDKKGMAIQVAKNFLTSAEFQRRYLSNSAFVDVLYQTFLDRAPDSKGKASWLAKLKSGVSRNTVMAGFYNSTEFSQLMAKYGIRTTSGTTSGTASGTWKGTSASSQVSSELVLSESSGKISGTLYWPKGDTRSVSGSRIGNSVTLNIAGGDVWRLTISGNKLAGTASKNGGGSYICTFTRQ